MKTFRTLLIVLLPLLPLVGAAQVPPVTEKFTSLDTLRSRSLYADLSLLLMAADKELSPHTDFRMMDGAHLRYVLGRSDVDLLFTQEIERDSKGDVSYYYTVTGGTNIHNLTIKFTKAIDYTLTANFTLPNGGTYSATKTVSVTPPKPDVVATSAQKLQDPYVSLLSPYGDEFPIYWVEPNNSDVMFALGNYNDSNVIYDWQSEYLSPYTGSGPFYTVYLPSQYSSPTLYRVKCQAELNGRYSQWAEVLLYVSESLPQPYRAPADSLTANYKLKPPIAQ